MILWLMIGLIIAVIAGIGVVVLMSSSDRLRSDMRDVGDRIVSLEYEERAGRKQLRDAIPLLERAGRKCEIESRVVRLEDELRRVALLLAEREVKYSLKTFSFEPGWDSSDSPERRMVIKGLTETVGSGVKTKEAKNEPTV